MKIAQLDDDSDEEDSSTEEEEEKEKEVDVAPPSQPPLSPRSADIAKAVRSSYLPPASPSLFPFTYLSPHLHLTSFHYLFFTLV